MVSLARQRAELFEYNYSDFLCYTAERTKSGHKIVEISIKQAARER
jgi:hypothetical protein